ncbi:RidA family protein [Prodigiosinella confusarubida]|uniref:RidA family protein n=1 Tax=Serratia sp. (strain ATCC 39006) TaxID=104623 RepID=A0A2I5TMI2_SERS3|nr:RidA family protein [Serratia sp. ATCC 39006]AUH01446.1 RidA family protein [Serratia sp. ATCC 39006]AUH05768.1 RidA family protein [Serratia sp. ATCC 39006]
MKIITSQQLPPPGGHYSQGVLSGNLLFVSGQLPFNQRTGTFPDGIEAQFVQAMKNVETVLHVADATLANLVNVQIFISDVEHWQTVNTHYAELLSAHRPARTIIPCGQLHYGALVEITAVAELFTYV